MYMLHISTFPVSSCVFEKQKLEHVRPRLYAFSNCAPSPTLLLFFHPRRTEMALTTDEAFQIVTMLLSLAQLACTILQLRVPQRLHFGEGTGT